MGEKFVYVKVVHGRPAEASAYAIDEGELGSAAAAQWQEGGHSVLRLPLERGLDMWRRWMRVSGKQSKLDALEALLPRSDSAA